MDPDTPLTKTQRLLLITIGVALMVAVLASLISLAGYLSSH